MTSNQLKQLMICIVINSLKPRRASLWTRINNRSTNPSCRTPCSLAPHKTLSVTFQRVAKVSEKAKLKVFQKARHPIETTPLQERAPNTHLQTKASTQPDNSKVEEILATKVSSVPWRTLTTQNLISWITLTRRSFWPTRMPNWRKSGRRTKSWNRLGVLP